MKKILLLLLLLSAIGGLLSAAEKSVYSCSFAPEKLAGWKIPPAFAKVETVDGAPALRVTVKPGNETKEQHFAIREIDLAPYRGNQLFLTYEVKGENVSVPPEQWNGVKLMLHFKTPQEEVWRGAGVPTGSFGWRTASATAFIPADATAGTINLGLQSSSGTVWVRSVKITASEPAATVPEGFRAVYTDRVKRMPRLRGVMSPNSFKPEDMDELKRWNANLIRWQIKRNWGRAGTELDLEEYLRWFNGRLEELDKVLDKCGKLGIYVLIDLHTPPGGRDETGNMVMFYNPVYRDAFYAMWEQMAKRYKDHPAVWGCNLLNEPVQTRPTEDDYLSVQYEAARRIRAIDPELSVIIESNNSSSPAAFPALQPLPLANIIYQAHMYAPYSYTHQGIYDRRAEPVVYPGVIEGAPYDRERLKRCLAPVREFEKKYGAKIYIGEFSAVRYAPGAAQYLEELISIFEEYGWDWSYHAFRESPYWDVELDAEAKPAETDRRKVLLKYFRRNR